MHSTMEFVRLNCC